MVKILQISDDEPGFIYLVERSEWCGRGAVPHPGLDRKYQFHKVSITYTNTRGCRSLVACQSVLREIEQEQMNKGHPDIKHNFLIGVFGTVYEGRGWDTLTEVKAKTRLTLDIAYIGTYMPHKGQPSHPRDAPDFDMLSAALNLVKYGLKNGYIKQTYTIGHVFPLRHFGPPKP